MIEQYDLPHFGGKLMSTQVSALLMKELKTGIFCKSEKLPSEVELAERLGVSRTVIRDALSDIEREGFVERVRGIGTVICRNIVNLTNRLDLKLEYKELIVNAGYTPVSDNIRLRTEAATEENAELLGVDTDSELIVCEKRMLAGNIPCIYSVDYISAALFEGIEYADIDWSLPIFDLLDKYCGLTVVTDITKVSATFGDEFVRNKLNLKPNDALIMLDEVGYCKLSRPVLRSLEFYTDFFDFTMLRKKF
ncbi:MAG: GntR family transcriptional regulator [Hydrogenoanaerobacterium sp.]